MQRIYEILLKFGYPPDAVFWLRRLRLPILIVLALLSWALFIGVGWLIWSAASLIIHAR